MSISPIDPQTASISTDPSYVRSEANRPNAGLKNDPGIISDQVTFSQAAQNAGAAAKNNGASSPKDSKSTVETADADDTRIDQQTNTPKDSDAATDNTGEVEQQVQTPQDAGPVVNQTSDRVMSNIRAQIGQQEKSSISITI